MFYLIDKPAGISSFTVIRKIRKILNIKKIGHSGTLDPFATGCLILATGKSTKLIPLLESAKKEYIATIRFDGKTDSYDTETPIVAVPLENFQWKSNTEIEEFLLSQKIQSPPKYSAIHIDGKRSYELARLGKQFQLKERPIEVYEASVLEKDTYELTIRMLVSSGCYMRSFGPLLGKFLGTHGGYLSKLRRTAIHGRYFDVDIKDCTSIDDSSEVSFDMLFHTIHTYEIDVNLMKKIQDGRYISWESIAKSVPNEELFFLKNSSMNYASLCRKGENELIIEKNDIE